MPGSSPALGHKHESPVLNARAVAHRLARFSSREWRVAFRISMQKPLLENKVIFLTGGGDGIGHECALEYAREGANVVIADINEAAAQKTLSELPTKGMVLPCDVTDSESVEGAVQRTLAKFGRIDAVHNNAGLASPSAPLERTSRQEWERLMAVNVTSVYLTTRYTLFMLKAHRGVILNTASMAGLDRTVEPRRVRCHQGRDYCPDQGHGAGLRTLRHPRERHLPGRRLDAHVEGLGHRTTGPFRNRRIPPAHPSPRLLPASGCGGQRCRIPSFRSGAIYHRLHSSRKRRGRARLPPMSIPTRGLVQKAAHHAPRR